MRIDDEHVRSSWANDSEQQTRTIPPARSGVMIWYASRDTIQFAAPDPDAARAALVRAGTTSIDEQTLPDGSRLVMLRDPWGLPLQLCKRATPLLPPS